jgi:uncharacterized protein
MNNIENTTKDKEAWQNYLPSTHKQRLLKFGSLTLLMLIIFLAVETLATFKNLRNIPARDTISVFGVGEIFAIPDLATFSFTISADAREVSLAQKMVSDKMTGVTKALEDIDIDKKDIKTVGYSTWPKYVYVNDAVVCTPTYCPPQRPGRQVPDGYTTSHSVIVKIRKTEDVGKALGLVGEKGATNISNVTFTIDDLEKINNEARALAIADAKSKAKTLSKELGVRLVRIVGYDDSSGDYPYSVPYSADVRSFVEPALKDFAPTIPTGENKIEMSVTVTYEIR